MMPIPVSITVKMHSMQLEIVADAADIYLHDSCSAAINAKL